MVEEQVSNQQQIQINEKQVKVFYFLHEDDFYSKNKVPLLVKVNDNIFNGFVKLKLNGRDIYYIFYNNNYIKLWKDKRDNILIYISNVKTKEEFLQRSQ